MDARGKSRSRVRIGGGATLVIVLAVWLLGGDPSQALRILSSAPQSAPTPQAPPPNDESAAFLSAVLAMTEDVWAEIFASNGATYRPPTLVLFSGVVQSGCGTASSASGPFYCPPDQDMYLDTEFFDQLARMGGPGDFAQAYVIGHEVGHHVQNLTGTLDEARRLQQRSSQTEANAIQVRIELQADCYAGVWAHHANRRGQVLEPGDVEEGLAAAAAIGDDSIARSAGRAARPESFTHGTSDQRRRWLMAGLETGDISACDTFR